MSPFELVFAVFGLLLGLAVAEVLGGFSRALKLKRGTKPIKIGWLTPLLGIFVVLDLTTFWLLAWEARDQIGANYVTLIAVLAIVGTYYLSATLIFPDEPEEWPDFNDWYDKQNRMVIGGLLAANISSWVGQAVLEAFSPSAETEAGSETAFWIVGLSGLAMVLLLVALLRVNNRRLNVAMLIVLIALLLVVGIGEEWI
jgi:hypothetical protein